jgi:hypothetical protein
MREEGSRPCRRRAAAHLLLTVNAAVAGLLELLGIDCGRAILTQQPSKLSLPALTDLPELMGFFSYSRDDDRDSEGGLTLLRRRIQSELRGQLGRSEKTLRLFQDAKAIPPGTLCGRRRYNERNDVELVRSFPVGENRPFVWTSLMRRMRVSAQKLKAAEDAAGDHNDDGDK